MRYYFVYILTNNSGTLYTGVTNELERRLSEHRAGIGSKFTGRYALNKLVHYEVFGDIREAISREKVIKGWKRAKKITLIEACNPGWLDLSDPAQALRPCKKAVSTPPSNSFSGGGVTDPSLRSG